MKEINFITNDIEGGMGSSVGTGAIGGARTAAGAEGRTGVGAGAGEGLDG